MTKPLQIYIGWDEREAIAFDVLHHSILMRATRPVEIIPLVQRDLRDIGIYTRERDPRESTDFSLTRFLVPYLSDYEGISIFMDCDMLCLTDIWQIVNEIDPNMAVSVCKHDYIPKGMTKFLGQSQTVYLRKNWSSLVVFNNEKCVDLTPEYINSALGLELHQFRIIPDDIIGSLSLEWNWLVGEYPKNPRAKILHYTIGGPWFEEYKNCDYAEEWVREYKKITDNEIIKWA